MFVKMFLSVQVVLLSLMFEVFLISLVYLVI